MEAVGGRLGRSSARYGPSVAFTGPVRKWKKRWTCSPSPGGGGNALGSLSANGGCSQLLLFKWTPVSGAGEVADATEEPPRKKFRYAPVWATNENQDARPVVNKTSLDLSLG